MTPNLPHRLTEKSFRRYESTIKAIVDQFPKPLLVNLGTLSQTTVVGRLRDAMASLIKYNWTTDIDMEKFREHYPDIIVVLRGKCVMAGGRSAIKPKDDLNPVLPVSESLSTLPTVLESSDEFVLCEKSLHLVCRLAAAGLLTRPIKFSVIGFVLDVVWWEEHFDIRIDDVGNGKFTVA